MRILLESGRGAFCLLLLLAVLFSTAKSLAPEVEVVGYAESSNIKNPHAFSGLRVTIECKADETKGDFVTRGSGEVDETGKFHLNIPHDIVQDDGTLKEACYAHLLSASGNPCPAEGGLEASKIVFVSKSGEKHIMGLKQNLKFSPEVCVSKFFWHTPNHKLLLPPPINLPPFPKFKKPCPPKAKLPPLVPKHKSPVVIHKKPSPPKIAHKQPVVTPKKPSPPKALVPIHKPHVPISKPIHKPHVPISKPIHKPPVVIPKKPCPPKAPVPIYKPPVVIPKKPCPPFPKFPPFQPKYIPHPKFGKWPPLPSHP